jgi:hypothetical protein
MNLLQICAVLIVTSVTKGRTQKLPKRLSKPTDMTIHWKALEEYLLMVPSVSQFKHFQGKMQFLNFSKKNPHSFKARGNSVIVNFSTSLSSMQLPFIQTLPNVC